MGYITKKQIEIMKKLLEYYNDQIDFYQLTAKKQLEEYYRGKLTATKEILDIIDTHKFKFK